MRATPCPRPGCPRRPWRACPRATGTRAASPSPACRTLSVSSSSRLGGSSTRSTASGSDRWSATENSRTSSSSSPKNSTSHRDARQPGEDVEDAAAHGELAAAGDHVDAGVGEVDEPGAEPGEVVPALPDAVELDRGQLGQVVRERLQRCAHRRDDDERAVSTPHCVDSTVPSRGSRRADGRRSRRSGSAARAAGSPRRGTRRVDAPGRYPCSEACERLRLRGSSAEPPARTARPLLEERRDQGARRPSTSEKSALRSACAIADSSVASAREGCDDSAGGSLESV